MPSFLLTTVFFLLTTSVFKCLANTSQATLSTEALTETTFTTDTTVLPTTTAAATLPPTTAATTLPPTTTATTLPPTTLTSTTSTTFETTASHSVATTSNNSVTTQSTISVVKSTTTKTTTATVQQFPFQHVMGLLGPRKEVDIVFLMGRTLEIGKRDFYQNGRPLTMALLKQYTSVHEAFARVAYVTYAGNFSVDYDDISGSKAPLDKCAMFPSVRGVSLPLDAVVYKTEEEGSWRGIDAAIQKTNEIFQAGKIKRPNAQQILFLVTDALFTNNVLPSSLVTIFGIGIGASFRDSALRGLVKEKNNYAVIKDWFRLTDTFPIPQQIDKPLQVDIPKDICLYLQSSLIFDANTTLCYCDVDYGVPRLECQSGFIDVLDENTAPLIDNEYKRVCMNETIFGNSCTSSKCSSRFCGKSDSNNCYDKPLICQSNCLNGGTCIQTDDDFICRCIDGFYGLSCQVNQDDCKFPGICMNNSTCTDDGDVHRYFHCNCSVGFDGDFCQNMPSTPPPSTTLKVVVESLDMQTSTIVGIVIGAFILLVILVGIIVLIALCLRQRIKNKRLYAKRSETGTSTEAIGSVSKWSVKNKNFSVRLRDLWKHRSLRGARNNDGMPSVPWKTHMKLSEIDSQNLSHDEAIFQNELIHDNRPLVENWKEFMLNLVGKNVIQKGLMVNIFTKDIVTTDDWEFNWSEVYTLDSVFGTETDVSVQAEDYYLKSPEDGVACGKSGSQYTNDKQTLLAVAKTKKYLIAAIVALSDSQDGAECVKQVRFVMNHVKSEGF